MSALRRLLPRRVAMLSVHTSPLDQPGTGDAGGMNVYVVETARRLARHGVEVEIFTRATSGDLAPIVELAPGVHVRHLPAGPFEPLAKEDLPGLLCSFSTGLLRVEALHEPGYFDLVHSHYWLSGQVGTLAQDRWRVPLVHSMHTMARVKNRWLPEGDTPEPSARAVGESQVVAAADRLLANTPAEAEQLVSLYDADPSRVAVVPPGVDLSHLRHPWIISSTSSSKIQIGIREVSSSKPTSCLRSKPTATQSTRSSQISRHFLTAAES